MRFDPDALRARLNSDDEFSYHARYWNGRVRLLIGRQALSMRLTDGSVSELTDDDTGFASSDVLLEAPAEVWDRILQPLPQPFYQDLWSAKFHHGFRMEGDLEMLSAYYPALQRLCGVLRELTEEHR